MLLCIGRMRLILTLLAVLLVGCSTAPRHHTPSSAQGTSVISAPLARDVVIHAISLVGTPYRYGGNTPSGGFDCSGLIHYVYRSTAQAIPPRTVAQLAQWGRGVSPGARRAGDLVLFGRGGRPTHAGIYVGGGRFVHAPSSGGAVRMDHLDSHYWSRQKVSFRRP